ncbi:MAG: diguanylate cyclase, partial [Spirochaetales bacterium]|nr:diguanylate cyclase [Spirochaetales bacterium]
ILTELMKMASGLGIETVVEGVETEEQVQFLKEIGCTKMQGFFYCRPIPVETIFERYEKGAQIGFENPDETPYYSSIGSINLYDIASVNNEDSSLSQYFNTVPMVIVEVDGKKVSIIRNNSSCRSFLDQIGEDFRRGVQYPYPQKDTIFGAEFAKAVRMCASDGSRQYVNARMPDGAIARLYLKRIAKNPVTGKIAFVGILLEYTDFSEVSFDSEEQIPTDTFVYSLASDYTFLYYVNLDNEHFVEYRPNVKNGELSVIRHGMNFFNEVRKDAPGFVYKDDLEKVLTQFTKENVIHMLATDNAFTLTYRLMIDGKPSYVSLKASKLGNFKNRVIIGVNNVQAQMEVQEAYERAKEEQMTVARISALSADIICIYIVDPGTDHYVEYSTSKEYAGLGISKSGDHFFEEAYKNAEEFIDPDDVDRVRSLLVKEKVLQNIEKTGLYSFNYRLLMGGEPTYVSLKAALVKEGDSNQLIIGISNINDQVKRDREYAYNLSMAKIRADIDALTGVKNRHAYLDFEDKLNASIKEKKNYPFALTVFDVNDLKTVNDEHGHNEGDRLIRDAAAIICTKLKHSPVFRIGGDEFVAVSSGQDYELIDSILKDFDKTNTLNVKEGKVVVSFGMSRFDGDSSVDNVFDRADINMYKYKKSFKAEFKKTK